MKEHLLFIDTEASGLPKNWSLPYEAKDNWPNCVQISWAVYTKDGTILKEEDHYIKNDDFAIDPSSIKIHGITRDYLNEHGECRKDVLQLLANDLSIYSPLVVGHFIQFDFHMLGADFYRAGIENPLKNHPSFCTMLCSAHLSKNPAVKFVRLEQLYQLLFNKELNDLHNAIVDAKATASCYFELVKRGEINEEIIEQQQKDVLKKEASRQSQGCLLPMLVIICLTILIFCQL